MHSIISKGKNVAEAIHLGLDILEATKKEVNIEIIQHETKGFLGIRSKEAIVKLTKLEASDPVEEPMPSNDLYHLMEEMVDQLPEEKSAPKQEKEKSPLVEKKEILDPNDTNLGKVWVENGQLYCRSSPTHFPMVTLSKGVRLFKNGSLVTEKTTIVSEKDTFEIKVESEEQDTKWQITMDQQKLKVFLEIKPGYKIIRHIPDIEPDPKIELTVAEKKEVHNHLSYEVVVEKLKALRVIHGFNQNEIIKALEATQPGTYEIATGIEPKPGKDGWIEFRVDTALKVGLKENLDGSVDYREIREIPTVKNGQVIGVIHPPIPGECGYTVTNEPLPATQTVPVVLKAGKGISLIDHTIVAMESGRPKVEKRGQFVSVSVMPKHTQYGDVDLTSGNIHFSGDVEVLGKVNEGMLVEAEGDIIVHKVVNRATLTASGAIISNGNIVGSEVSAGKNNMLITELGHLLGVLHQQTEKMLLLIDQLTHSPAFKNTDFSKGGLKPLLSILLEKRFKSFPELAKKYVVVVKKGEGYLIDQEWREVAVTLSQLFLSLTHEVISYERIFQLSQKMKQLHEISQTPVEPDSYISIPSANNSRLYCSGNITIHGKGCVNTKIHAGGLLKINGIIRGGEVYGRLGAEINESGADIGTFTLIAVPSDQKIKITKAMEGTSIKIGNIKYTFKETTYKVLAYLDQEERLILN